MIVAAMLALSGCATTWSRVATSDADFNLDNRACQHMNTQTVSASSVLARDYVAVYGYKRCMIEEGYTEGGIWKGYSGWRNEWRRTGDVGAAPQRRPRRRKVGRDATGGRRRSGCHMLVSLGYVVLETGDPQHALRLTKEQPIHLLVVDG